MFIVENNKIKNEKSFLAENVFSPVRMDFEFLTMENLEGSRCSLELNGIECKKYMIDDSTVSFRYIFLDFIQSKTESVSIKLIKDSELILQDEIEITINEFQEKQEELQGILYDAFPIKNSTKVKFLSPDLTKDVTSFSDFFSYYQKMESISFFNTSNGTNFYQMFYSCRALKTIPLLDFSKGTNFNNMFRDTDNLESIPEIDVSSGDNFKDMFRSSGIKTIPELNVINGTKFSDMFTWAEKLENFGGLKNAKYSFSLSNSKKLTHDSLINVLNGLYDLTGSNQQTLTLGTTNLDKLTDQEKAIATNKNWILA